MSGSAQPSSFKPSYIGFLLLLLILFLIEFQLVVMQKKLNRIEQKQLRISEMIDNTRTTADEVLFEKRTMQMKSGNPISNELSRINEDSLIGLRCTQVMVNDGDDMYWWRSPYSHDLYDKVEDVVITNALKEANGMQAGGKTVISARLCETEYGNAILNYVIADREGQGAKGYYDGIDADAYLTVLGETGSFKPGIHVMHENAWPYALCNAPAQMTKDGKIYMTCSVAQSSDSYTYLHVVDLVHQTSSVKMTCTYNYDSGIKESCTSS